MKKCLIIGGRGFIGSHIASDLKLSGYDVDIPERGDISFLETYYDAIVYAAGYGVCSKPIDVIDSNVNFFNEVLFKANYEHLIYISSTRLYMAMPNTNENSDLQVLQKDERKLFNLSKLVSEEVARLSGKNVTIIRPSNVYGIALNSNLFLPMIIKSALTHKKIDMYVEPEYEKDYVSVDDLSNFVTKCVTDGFKYFNVYNVASGVNISAKSIAEIIQKDTNCKVNWHTGFVGDTFTPINIDKSMRKCNFKPKHLLDELPSIIASYKKILSR
jgi:nucleoside-diphosphate-sugar epimerase